MNNLNPQQQNAAFANGSVSITAGAGTGKTHVLSERFYHLLESNHWSPLSVVAVTFTDKAADELRSRIRGRVTERSAKPETVAEVDAAQISTIHGLAARICRDFYDIAGIPADFRVMDENDSKLWTLDKIEEAIGAVCEREAYELGYSTLTDALTQLLSDPYTAEKAFANSTKENWRLIIGGFADDARKDFSARLESAEFIKRLREISGPENDLIEQKRQAALAAVDSVIAGNFSDADGLGQISLGGGSPSRWPEGQFNEAKALLAQLKKEARAFIDKRDLQFGTLDEELLAKVQVLRSAFGKARDHLSGAKFAAKYLDYNDLELFALKILNNADAVAHYRARWKAFLIDEFQDTNRIQSDLIRLLTADANLTVVGDEKQSIYGFRGADVEVFKEFRMQIAAKGGEEVVLQETYRANSTLVESTNRIFEPLLGAIHQPLTSGRAYAGANAHAPVTLAYVDDDDHEKRSKQYVESRHMAGIVGKMVDEKVRVFDKDRKNYRPVEFRDFAVLSRVWEPLEIYGDAFAEAGIPAVNAGGGSLIDTREFKDACALITFLADQLDDLSLVSVLRSPFFAVSDTALYKFARTVGSDTSWWPVLREASDLDPHLSAARDCLAGLLKERVHHSPEGLLRLAARETGYAAVIANLPHGQRREADWSGTLQFIRGMQEKGREDVFSVVRYLRIAVRSELEIPRPTIDSGDAVSLMTVHAAKGLEWPVVFVPDVSRQFQSDSRSLAIDAESGVALCLEEADGEKVEPPIFTAVRQMQKAKEDDERRRLLYVALTRAGDFVHLTSAGAKGALLDILQPGLAAASVPCEEIEIHPAELLPPAPGEPVPFPDLAADTDPANVAAESVMATGISAYAACPRKYKFQYVDGHPGLGEGFGDAALIGTLAHLALELDIDSPEILGLNSECADAELLGKALEQARNFRKNDAFAAVRSLPADKELRFNATIGDIRVFGIADLVGEDFVLDYKTDAVTDPDKHSLQLWAYARALGKPKAYIAYLRHNLLTEFTPDDLARLDGVGSDLIAHLRSGDFAANASPSTCPRCTYSSICVDRHDPGDETALV